MLCASFSAQLSLCKLCSAICLHASFSMQRALLPTSTAKSCKHSSFGTPTTPIPAEGSQKLSVVAHRPRQGRAETQTVEKVLSFQTLTTQAQEDRAGTAKVESLQLLHINHAGPQKVGKTLSQLCTPIPRPSAKSRKTLFSHMDRANPRRGFHYFRRVGLVPPRRLSSLVLSWSCSACALGLSILLCSYAWALAHLALHVRSTCALTSLAMRGISCTLLHMYSRASCCTTRLTILPEEPFIMLSGARGLGRDCPPSAP